MVETVWQGENYEIIINSAGRRHCRDRDTGVFVDMEKCLEERERLEERRRERPPIKRGVKISAGKAARRYRRGIEAIGGASTYKQCGRRKNQGFLAVASCLESAKEEKLTTDLMVRHYRQSA